MNIVKNTLIQPDIRLQGWESHCVFNASSGDLLVVISNDSIKQSKVLRFCSFTEKVFRPMTNEKFSSTYYSPLHVLQ